MRIGIDLGGTSVSAGLVGEDYKILFRTSMRTLDCNSEQEIVGRIIKCVHDLMEKSGAELNKVEAIGIGSPGETDFKNGIILGASNLPLCNTPIADILRKEFKKEVFLDNDANCAAWGEFTAGCAKDCDNIVMVTLGTGIGGGIIIDKKILHGTTNHAGEIGHIVIDINGRPCTCGRTGCWETVASTRALISTVKYEAEKKPSSILNCVIKENNGMTDGKTLFNALKRNCPLAQDIFSKYIELLSVGIFNIYKAYQPEMIILGGGISKEGEVLIAPLREKVPGARIVASSLGDSGGIIGAAVLCKSLTK